MESLSVIVFQSGLFHLPFAADRAEACFTRANPNPAKAGKPALTQLQNCCAADYVT